MPEVEAHWHDGGMMPNRPEGFPEGKELMGPGGGLTIFHGTKDTLVCGYMANKLLCCPVVFLTHQKYAVASRTMKWTGFVLVKKVHLTAYRQNQTSWKLVRSTK